MIVLFLGLVCGVFAAEPIPLEEFGFHFAPSFWDGIGIRIMRFADGKIRFSSYSMPLHRDGTNSAPKLLKEGPVTKADFEALKRMFDEPDPRSEAESDDRAHFDGESWLFSQSAGRRTVRLELRSPPGSAAAYKLGKMFFKIAQVVQRLPEPTAPTSQPEPAGPKGASHQMR